MKRFFLLQLVLFVSIFTAAAAACQESLPQGSPPRVTQEKPPTDLELAKKFARADGIPEKVVQSFDSLMWISNVVETIRSPFVEQGWASAVYVASDEKGRQLFVTAAHNLSNYRDVLCGEKSAHVVVSREDIHMPVRVVYVDGANDIAVVRMIKEPGFSASPATLAAKIPEVGDELYMMGYPPVNAAVEFQTALRTRYRGLYTNFVSQQVGPFVVQKVVGHMFLDSGVERAYSGGMLTNTSGEVVGILILISPSGRFTIAVPLDHVKQALDAVRSGHEFCSEK